MTPLATAPSPPAGCPLPGSLKHILLDCPDLTPARLRVLALWSEYLEDKPVITKLVNSYTLGCDQELQVQFLLDCSVLPTVISETRLHGKYVLDSLFYMTRTLCFSVHKARLKLLGKWNFI